MEDAARQTGVRRWARAAQVHANDWITILPPARDAREKLFDGG